MRSQDKQRACVCCGRPTRFERDVHGPRGVLLRWEPCCPSCGENGAPAREATS